MRVAEHGVGEENPDAAGTCGAAETYATTGSIELVILKIYR
jgi:hypothetical protein